MTKTPYTEWRIEHLNTEISLLEQIIYHLNREMKEKRREKERCLERLKEAETDA